MTDMSRRGGRRGSIAAAAASAALLVMGVFALVLGVKGQDGPPAPALSAATAPRAPSPRTTQPTPPPGTTTPAQSATPPAAQPAARLGPFLPASQPTRIEIGSIGLRTTSFVPLQLASDATITVPGTADEVGLYENGPTPGQLGPAVLAAHVDSKKGPGVFYRLGSVKVRDTVTVSRADGRTLTYTVDKVATYPKDAFPTDAVYHGSFTRSEIRLVTCGGPFDKVKHYLDNVVVFGHLTRIA
ncbi:MAG: class F sortase [Actinomycetota bacterium]|nr:class F sortase [Actinomycetota bacterium]